MKLLKKLLRCGLVLGFFIFICLRAVLRLLLFLTEVLISGATDEALQQPSYRMRPVDDFTASPMWGAYRDTHSFPEHDIVYGEKPIWWRFW